MCKKRLPKGFGSISILNKGKGLYCPYMARKRDISGKYVVVGYFKTYKEAFEELARLFEKDIKSPDKMSFSAVFERWVEDENPTVEAMKHHNSAFKWCGPLHGRVFSKLDIYDLEECIDRTNEDEEKIIPRTMVGRIKTVWCGMYRWAVAHKIVSFNLAEQINWKGRINNKTERTGKVFTEDELKKIWDLFLNGEKGYPRWLGDMFALMMYTGMRPGKESCGIPRSSLDWQNGLFRWGSKTEAGVDRPILFLGPVEIILRNWADKAKGEEIVPCNYLQLRDTARRWFDAHGMSDHILYDFRHTWNTQAKKKGISEYYRKLFIGHRQESIGERVYIHSEALLKEYKLEMSKFSYDFNVYSFKDEPEDN